MSLLAECEVCGKKYKLADKFAGRTLPCKECGANFDVPGGSDLDDALSEMTEEDTGGSVLPPRRETASRPTPRKSKPKSQKRRGHGPARREASETDLMLRKVGIWLTVFGVGVFILPMLGLEWKLINFLGDAQSTVGAIAAGIGALLIAVSSKENPAKGFGIAAGILVGVGILFVIENGIDVDNPFAGGEGAAADTGADSGEPLDDGNRQAQNTAAQNPRQARGPNNNGRPTGIPTGSRRESRGASGGGNVRGAAHPGSIGASQRTALLGGNGGGPVDFTGAKGDDMIGVRFALGNWANQDVLKTLEPLFASGSKPGRGTKDVRAKPGYVVGGLIVDAKEHVNAVQVIFMKSENGKIKTDDSYLSDVIGKPTGRQTQILGGDGRKVIGIQGRKGLIMDAVGLILDK